MIQLKHAINIKAYDLYFKTKIKTDLKIKDNIGYLNLPDAKLKALDVILLK